MWFLVLKFKIMKKIFLFLAFFCCITTINASKVLTNTDVSIVQQDRTFETTAYSLSGLGFGDHSMFTVTIKINTDDNGRYFTIIKINKKAVDEIIVTKIREKMTMNKAYTHKFIYDRNEYYLNLDF